MTGTGGRLATDGIKPGLREVSLSIAQQLGVVMARAVIKSLAIVWRPAAFALLIASCFWISPAAAQFVCGAAGTYPVVGGSVTIQGGGTATGSTGNFVCGQGADASGTPSTNNTAIGRNADAHGNTDSENVATGMQSNASGDFSFNTATGASANASSTTAGPAISANVATGAAALASGDGSRNVAIGSAEPLSGLTSGMPNASGNGSNNIAIGSNAIASGDNATNIAIGTNSTASNSAVAFGTGASATFANSAAIGNGATVTRANQQAFGTASNTYTMAGVTSAASKAAQSGTVQFVTSDSAGNLATTSAAALGIATTADLSAINSRLDDLTTRSNRAYNGIAMAFAMAGVPTLMPGEKLAMTMNYGTFEGTSGLAINASFRLGDTMQLAAGIGYGPNENIAGGRVGLRVAW